MSSSGGHSVLTFEQADSEAEAWKHFSAHLSVENWDDFYDAVVSYAPRIREYEAARATLKHAFEEIDEDLIGSDVLLLLVQLSAEWAEEERLKSYELLRELTEGKNSFLRSRAIQAEGLFAHTLSNKLIVLGHLIGRAPEKDADCAIAHIRSLRRAYAARAEPQLEQCLQKYHDDPRDRVRSEAYHQSSQVSLLSTAGAKDLVDFERRLDASQRFAVAAQEYDASRPDVELALATIRVVQFMRSGGFDPEEASRAVLDLRRLVLQSYADVDPGDHPDALSVRCVTLEAVERVAKLIEDLQSVPEALDGTPHLVSIAQAVSFLLAVDGSSTELRPTEAVLTTALKEGFRRYVEDRVTSSLWAKLQHSTVKVQQLLAKGTALAPEVRSFYEEVLKRFQAFKEEGVVKAGLDPRLLAMLARLHPERTVDELAVELASNQKAGSLETFLLNQLSAVAERQGLAQHFGGYLGGYPKAQRILASLEQELTRAMPDYDLRRRGIALNVVRYLLYYLFAATDRRLPTDYLMSKAAKGKGKDAVEADLEESLLAFLLATDIAYAIEGQRRTVGGRVDLAAHFGDVFFPIEVKREHKKLDRDHINKNYLAQAAAYTRASDRLGIFLLLDLTVKKKGEPLPDLKNLVWLADMTPVASGLSIHVPDYVIVVVIPGNMPRPSDLSKYSS